jgi:hypothetical protein
MIEREDYTPWIANMPPAHSLEIIEGHGRGAICSESTIDPADYDFTGSCKAAGFFGEDLFSDGLGRHH